MQEHYIPKNILITTRPLKGALCYDIAGEQFRSLKKRGLSLRENYYETVNITSNSG